MLDLKLWKRQSKRTMPVSFFVTGKTLKDAIREARRYLRHFHPWSGYNTAITAAWLEQGGEGRTVIELRRYNNSD